MPITDNNGSAYYNLNLSVSYMQTMTTALTPLSSFVGGEVLIVNRGPGVVNIYDNNMFSDDNLFMLSAAESFIFRGISNTNSVSAKTTSGNAQVNYRVSRYSNQPH